MRATLAHLCRAIPLTIALVLAPNPVGACCGPPRHPGLWEALAEADAVVVGEIEQVTPTLASQGVRLLQDAQRALPPRLASWTRDVQSVQQSFVARLRVQKVIKGPIPQTIHFDFDDSCFTGGFGLPGETVVAYLRREGLMWKPLPWGASITYSDNPQHHDDLVAALESARTLQESGLGTSPLRRQWAVVAASLPGSRPYLERELYDATPRELAELATAFVHLPSGDEQTNVWMLHRLADYPDPRVDRAALAMFEAWRLHYGSEPYFTDEILKRHGIEPVPRWGSRPQPPWPSLGDDASVDLAPWLLALRTRDKTMRRLIDKLGRL